MTATLDAAREAAKEAAMEEHRSVLRNKTFLKGIILFNNRKSSADCLIRDLTEHGARLMFSSTIITPDVIELQIPNKDQILPAHIRWRKGDEAGVVFTHVAPAAGDIASPAAATVQIDYRVEKLEAEVAKMHRQIVELRNEMRKLQGD